VCTPDEHQYIEMFGGTRLYYEFRERVRKHYRSLGLSAMGAAQPLLSAGNCWVNTGFSVEAKVALEIFTQMLAPYIKSGNLTIYYSTYVHPDGCEWTDDSRATIQSLTATHADDVYKFTARYFLDATDLGDLLVIADARYFIGAESWQRTGEPSAPVVDRPDWVQAITFPIAVKLVEGSSNRAPKPTDYDELEKTQHFDFRDGAIDGVSSWVFTGVAPWWTYRRIIAEKNFADDVFPNDVSTVNTDANDYLGGSIPTSASTMDILEKARDASRAYLYWMQRICPNDPPHEGKTGYPQIQPDPDFFGTPDGLSPDPYIRESRRIAPLKPIVAQDIVDTYNAGPRATFFRDSCGVGMYSIDIHRSSQEMPEIDMGVKPFQIPTSALIPIDKSNLLPASKNLGVTHITNGAYRVHPVEWNIGESAAALACYCLDIERTPREVPDDITVLRLFQKALVKAGIPLFWWIDVPVGHPAFEAVQLLAMERIILPGDDLNFRPYDLLRNRESAALLSRVHIPVQWPQPNILRGDAAIFLARQLGMLP